MLDDEKQNAERADETVAATGETDETESNGDGEEQQPAPRRERRQRSVRGERSGEGDLEAPVSYTHLTLPTRDLV